MACCRPILRPAGRAHQCRSGRSSPVEHRHAGRRSCTRHRSCSRWRSSGETSVKITSPGSASMIASDLLQLGPACGRRTRHARPAPRPRTGTPRRARPSSPSRRSSPRSGARAAARRACPSCSGDKPGRALGDDGRHNSRPVPSPTGRRRRSASPCRRSSTVVDRRPEFRACVGGSSTDTRPCPSLRSARSGTGPRRLCPRSSPARRHRMVAGGREPCWEGGADAC